MLLKLVKNLCFFVLAISRICILKVVNFTPVFLIMIYNYSVVP